MTIEILGTIEIVHTQQKPYWHKRKGYYVGDRWVKPKKVRKFKAIPIKQPYLFGDIKLRVDSDDFNLNEVFADESGRNYICTQVMAIPKPVSILTVLKTNLGKTFSAPKQLLKLKTINHEA